MNTLFETEERQEQQDSELTLGTGTLLAIFFGLVVVCGVFFGFGYSMGRHSSDARTAAAQSAPAVTAEPVAPAISRPKPSALEAMPPQQASAPVGDAWPPNADEQPAASPARAPRRQEAPVTPKAKPRQIAAASSPATPAPSPTPLLATANAGRALQPATPSPQTVQIAAVTHAEDAQALVAALKKRGYTVSVRNEPQDKLMHVQVGPFASHADAVTMRQKLLSDGYNAIIK